MKKSMVKFQFLPVALLLFCSIGAGAHDLGGGHGLVTEINTHVSKDNLVGGWAYTVEGAPEGYEKGFLVIMKENGQYKVQVQVGSSTLMGENVNVKGKDINFDVMVEGEKVKVALTAKGSSISGTSTSSSGTYTINGVKSISAE